MESSRGSYIKSDLEATELRLGLPGTTDTAPRGSKRALETECSPTTAEEGKETAPVAKAQVVGWPPVRSYRKNTLQLAKKVEAESTALGLFVKVSMDGAPYLRKIDLNFYRGYKELRHALDGMFKCFSSTDMEISRSEFAIAYEDKDGDWMLAGDVPWEMFASSCKRLRIMKGSEARGLGSSS